MNLPFQLKPAYKEYLWGGSRLNDDFNLSLPADPFAEAWMCSTHPDGESVYGDQRLSEVLKANPSFLGTHPLQTTGGLPVLPILVKLIDADKDLSVQVHPDDEYALSHEGELGKTEMWYVLDAKPDSKLIYGFNRDMEAEQVRDAINDASIEKYLNKVPVHKGDLFYIEAGTVHAIGAGCLIAEIQESSNLTYRLFDYGRVDKYGNTRQLHVDKALEVMKLESSIEPRQPMCVLKYRKGYAAELLTRCKYFQVERFLLNTEIQRELVDYQTDSDSFHILLCIDGCGSITGDNIFMNFFKGDCIFVPANSIPLKLHGKAQFLDVRC